MNGGEGGGGGTKKITFQDPDRILGTVGFTANHRWLIPNNRQRPQLLEGFFFGTQAPPPCHSRPTASVLRSPGKKEGAEKGANKGKGSQRTSLLSGAAPALLAGQLQWSLQENKRTTRWFSQLLPIFSASDVLSGLFNAFGPFDYGDCGRVTVAVCHDCAHSRVNASHAQMLLG